jgi:hypothetical protein
VVGSVIGCGRYIMPRVMDNVNVHSLYHRIQYFRSGHGLWKTHATVNVILMG